MSNYQVHRVGLKGKLNNPLIPEPWAHAANTSSLQFVSIMSGQQENAVHFYKTEEIAWFPATYYGDSEVFNSP